MWGDADGPERASNTSQDARIGRGSLIVDIARIVDSRAFSQALTGIEPTEPTQYPFLVELTPDEKKRLAQYTALRKAEMIIQLVASRMTLAARQEAARDELQAWADLGVQIDDATRQAINEKFCT